MPDFDGVLMGRSVDKNMLVCRIRDLMKQDNYRYNYKIGRGILIMLI
ncbi:hypothetical protein [Ruminiclostridium cellobioparum]|nr:hypothetical protein [Ruminiclostridium cellobioparum]